MAIAIGYGHSLALKTDGSLVTWGENWGDQTNVPVELRNVVAIAAGESHSLALIGYGPPLTAVPLENPAWDTGGFRFSIPTQSGRVYALEYKDLLTKDHWTALPLLAGTGTRLTVTDPTATGTQRFYRVRRW